MTTGLPTNSTVAAKHCAWVVFLLTSPSYLPGILVLAHTLHKYRSKYPLVVAVNPSLPEECKAALIDHGLEVREVEPILPAGKTTVIAERFKDVWTKLRVYEFTDFERVALIDGDMMLRKNMDELFDIPLAIDEIAATHACVCNLDKSSWAPESWTRDNCPWTHQTHPSALKSGAKPSHTTPHTYTLLNAGLVILHPSRSKLSTFILFLHSVDPDDQAKVGSWMFPEQDFLADAHRGKWHSLSWKYNAYKTMRYWHGSFWRDDEVVNLHYIVDKPWSRRPVRSQGGGGRYIVDHGDKYSQPLECELGKPSHLADAVTHGWWWDEFEEMRDDMLSAEAVGDDKARKVRTYLERFVAQ